MTGHSNRLPTVAIFALVVALIGAILVEIGSFRQPFSIVLTLIPVCAAIGILLRRVWSAYGFALYQVGSLLAVALISTTDNMPRFNFWLLITLSGMSAILFYLTGRALSQAGATRGWAWPWIALAAVTTIPLIFFQVYALPTSSMEDTLLQGDHLLVRIFPRASVRNGDLVVFHFPIDRHQIYVKRILGSHGDRIRIASRVLYRNGSQVPESYAKYSFAQRSGVLDHFPLTDFEEPFTDSEASRKAFREMSSHTVSGELIVPKGKYFVLGDNRDNSLDSRYWGLLNETDVVGKPTLVYYSEMRTTKRFGLPQIRWNRTLKSIY